ncbi:MAG TPA: diguanylate cyclase [Gammaproteobacteria bacterium]|nr:diguanylate cyclase [Gammaproteobacteria bacterium]
METGRDAFGIRSLNRHTLEQIVSASSAGILVVDASHPELPIVYANAAYERLTGYALSELAGHPWAPLARAEDGDAVLAPLKTAIGRGAACRASIPDVRKDGTSFSCDISVTPLHGPRGDLRYFLLSHEHATSIEQPASAPQPSFAEEQPPADAASAEIALLQRELGRARQKIATIDRIDQGTGLVRFAYFQETLRRDLAMARRDRRFVTILVFEIVEFAVYRQTFGDKAADSCQRMIGAQIMRALRRAGDLCARYDDTTLVAAVVGQHASEVQPLAERIAESVGQLKLHNPRAKGSRYIETRAIVIGCPPGAHDDPGPLIERAIAEARGNSLAARVG